MSRVWPVLALAGLVGFPAAQAPQSEPAAPPTTRQVIRACEADFARWCDGRMAGGTAERACLRQYWSTLSLPCRVVLGPRSGQRPET